MSTVKKRQKNGTVRFICQVEIKGVKCNQAFSAKGSNTSSISKHFHGLYLNRQSTLDQFSTMTAQRKEKSFREAFAELVAR
jgi:hypothetical protein